MRLSEVKGEEALDLLADIIDPATEIMTDPQIKKLAGEQNKAGVIKLILKNHKKSIIEILARIDGIPVQEYEMNALTLPIRLLDLLNDPEMVSFFTSAELMEGQTPSIAPVENTKAKEK